MNSYLKEALVVLSADTSTLIRIAQDLISQFFPEVPLPQFKIVNHTKSKWYGRAEAKWSKTTGEKTPTVIKIQKKIIDDENALTSVLAHELIHHWQYENINYLEFAKLGKYSQNDLLGHGKSFHEMADKINAVYGKDFVTETSDLSAVETGGREYYLLIQPSKSQKGKFWTRVAIRPSSTQKQIIKRVLENDEGHIVKTDNKVFLDSATIKKNGKVSTFKDDHLEALKELYEGPNLDKDFL